MMVFTRELIFSQSCCCGADDDSGDGGGDQFGDNDCSHGDIDCGDTRFKAG